MADRPGPWIELKAGETLVVGTGEVRNDAKDAARYRWLREQLRDKRLMVRAQALFWLYTSRKQFDVAVDAAMSSK